MEVSGRAGICPLCPHLPGPQGEGTWVELTSRGQQLLWAPPLGLTLASCRGPRLNVQWGHPSALPTASGMAAQAGRVVLEDSRLGSMLPLETLAGVPAHLPACTHAPGSLNIYRGS